MDAELEFAIQTSTTGKQLFDQVRYYYHSQHWNIFVLTMETKVGFFNLKSS